VSIWETVPGHPDVVAQLQAASQRPVHAYLLVGPPGAGARAAATAFAAALVCERGGCGTCRDCVRVVNDSHPDVMRWEPEGAAISVEQVRDEIVPMAYGSPLESRRRVVILGELHRADRQAPMLLKTIEEPPATTVFVILADTIIPELVTIASRCVRLDVPPLPVDTVADLLVRDGVDPERAVAIAGASLGDLDRARILVADPALGQRREAWWLAPSRLDGTGASVVAVVDELRSRIEEASGPLKEVQSAELAELERWVKENGERGSGRRDLVARHRRQARRHRAEELRFGLATLSARYRDALGDGTGAAAPDVVTAVGAIDAASEALTRNPNETLLLHALLLKLPSLAS
jgi:DNA polymerase-3 subunit delta'